MSSARREPPSNLNHLNLLITSRAGTQQAAQILMRSLATVIVCQMLPEDAMLGSLKGAVKGGTAMKLRMGRTNARFSADLDMARHVDLEEFLDEFQSSLRDGWAGFVGRLVTKKPPKPLGVPSEYVMLPFEIKLTYKGKSWRTVEFELGADEIGDTKEVEYVLSEEIREDLGALGFFDVKLIPLIPIHHQIAQKIHASTASKSERAHDLVDLQLIVRSSQINYQLVRATCLRLFEYRQKHIWPPLVVANESWRAVYEEAREDLDVISDLDEAIDWANGFITRIDQSDSSRDDGVEVKLEW
jgi:hypothetical protein